jgi:hypothetical protein
VYRSDKSHAHSSGFGFIIPRSLAELTSASVKNSAFNPNNPLERHAGESRHPAIEIDREADKTKVLSYLRRDLLINWIPAFAGMTLFCPIGQSGFKTTR